MKNKQFAFLRSYKFNMNWARHFAFGNALRNYNYYCPIKFAWKGK